MAVLTTTRASCLRGECGVDSDANLDQTCDHCGYDLQGLPKGRCPECGRPCFRFTDRARVVIQSANACAVEALGHRLQGQRAPGPLAWLCSVAGAIEPWHFLVAIATGPRGVGLHALESCGVGGTDLARETIALHRPRKLLVVPKGTKLPLLASTRLVVDQAIEASFSLGQSWVGTEHLVVALCRHPDDISRRALRRFGVTAPKVWAFVEANAKLLAARGEIPEAN